MQTPQPFIYLLAVTLMTAGCTRADTNEQARDAAAEVKQAAARAGETLSDAWLTAKVQARFFVDEQIKARHIDVATRDRVVTVRGYVDSDATRQRVLDLARNTDGVGQVVDELLIGQRPQDLVTSAPAPDPSMPSSSTTPQTPAADQTGSLDANVVSSLIQARYFLDPKIKARSIEVSVQDGAVTLMGEVASEEERNQALQLARTTHGVERVEDGLTIDASLDAPAAPLSAGANPQLPSTAAPPALAPPGNATRAPAAAGKAASAPAPTSPGNAVGTGGTRGAATGDAPAVVMDGMPGNAANLQSTLASKLKDDSALKAAKIEVSVSGSVATLSGSVPSPAARQRALTLARQTEGVGQVVDRMVTTK